MAHGSQKAAFRLVGRVRNLTRLLQNGRILNMPGHIMEGAEPGILAMVAGEDKAHLQMLAVNFQPGFALGGEFLPVIECGNQRCGAARLQGKMILQQYLVITMAQHTQAGGCTFNHGATEGLAFGNIVMGLAGGGDDSLVVPPTERQSTTQPHQQQGEQTEQRPQGIVDKGFQTDGIDAGPGSGVSTADLKHQPVAG